MRRISTKTYNGWEGRHVVLRKEERTNSRNKVLTWRGKDYGSHRN